MTTKIKFMRVTLAFRAAGSDVEQFMDRVVEYDTDTQDPPEDWTWSILPFEEGWKYVHDVRFVSAIESSALKAGREWSVIR